MREEVRKVKEEVVKRRRLKGKCEIISKKGKGTSCEKKEITEESLNKKKGRKGKGAAENREGKLKARI